MLSKSIQTSSEILKINLISRNRFFTTKKTNRPTLLTKDLPLTLTRTTRYRYGSSRVKTLDARRKKVIISTAQSLLVRIKWRYLNLTWKWSKSTINWTSKVSYHTLLRQKNSTRSSALKMLKVCLRALSMQRPYRPRILITVILKLRVSFTWKVLRKSLRFQTFHPAPRNKTRISYSTTIVAVIWAEVRGSITQSRRFPASSATESYIKQSHSKTGKHPIWFVKLMKCWKSIRSF